MTESEKKAVSDFAERLQNYYKHLNGKTASGMVVYHIEQVKKEFLGGNYGREQSEPK
jgi:DNA-binding protein Fis